MRRSPLLSFAVLIFLVSVHRSYAAVTVSWNIVDTPELPGFKTATVFVTGTHQIVGFDFAGDGNNDPAVGKGFFGPLQQVDDAIPSIFDNSPALLPPRDPRHDSHFLLTNGVAIDIRSGVSDEGANLLQAFFFPSLQWGELLVPFAQLIIPTGGTVTYRGRVFDLSGTAISEFDVSGVITAVPEPANVSLAIAVMVVLLPLRRRFH